MNLKNSEFTLDELKILAENGQKDLQYAVGYYYENGINTEVDFKQAAEWYEKAASKNHVEALMHLGMFYAQGKGVDKMERKLWSIFKKRLKPEIKMPNIIWHAVTKKESEPLLTTAVHLTGIKKQQNKMTTVQCAVWAVIS